MTLISDVQGLSPGALVVFYELDLSSLGGSKFYFHNERVPAGGSLWWQGVEYVQFPITAEGFESSQGKDLPKPTVSVANVTGVISSLIREWDDLLGSKFIRRRTLSTYLDAVNFPGGNPLADPSQQFPDEEWAISRKSAENNVQVTFEMCAAFDLENEVIPARPCAANCCPWLYRGSECSYGGGAVADYNDYPTSDITKDVCGKRETSCRLRFGDFSPLPYGGFVGVGIVR